MGRGAMRISPERLEHEAESTGFKADILEKVALLLGALEAICNHPVLRGNLVLKGGTALKPSRFSNGRPLTCNAIKDYEVWFQILSPFLILFLENRLRKSWKNQAQNRRHRRQRHNRIYTGTPQAAWLTALSRRRDGQHLVI